MRLLEKIRAAIVGPRVMATVRFSSWLILYEISQLYKIQHKATSKGFRGWVMVSSRGRLEAELEGPKEMLEDFVNRIADGRLTGKAIPLERAWAPYQNRYTALRLRLHEMVYHDRFQPRDE
jgi:acylphosphatase